MTWLLAAAAAAASAAAHQRFLVPRLPVPETMDDEDPPDYPAFASIPDVVGAALLALGCGLLVLPGLPAGHLVLWVAYLGAGAALVWVDLRSTWLPRRLHIVCLAQVALGLSLLAVTDWRSALAGLLGGLIGAGFFHLVWRLGTGLGYGDVRLAALVGAIAGTAGAQHWVAGFLAGTVVGALWGIGHALARRTLNTPAHFPYGPALWLGPVLAGWISGW